MIFDPGSLILCLIVAGPAILQIFLCLKVRSWVIKIAPTAISFLLLLFSFYKAESMSGWDSLGWTIMFIVCVYIIGACLVCWAACAIASRITHDKDVTPVFAADFDPEVDVPLESCDYDFIMPDVVYSDVVDDEPANEPDGEADDLD